MKCFSVCLFGLLSLVAAASVKVRGDTSPVTKVVNLLNDLKAKIVSDGKSEEQMYNKYACWCENTAKRKAADINTAESDLRALGQQILMLKGKVATLAAEIKEAEEKLDENEDEQAEATSMREKNNAKFTATAAETKQAIAALETAIKVLVKGTKLLQTDSDLETRTLMAVQSVLDKLPSDASFKQDDISFLHEFVTNGAQENYAPQSATIQGILSDMYATFAKNLQEAMTTEATQNKNYEKLMATLQKEASDLKAVKDRKETEKSDAESTLADTSTTYDETQEQMKTDIEFFDKTKAACTSKHEEWTLRAKLRAQELIGVEKAAAILSTDDSRELFEKAIKPGVEAAASFIQVDDAEAVAFKAYDMLKAQATKTKSLRLAALAVRLRTTKVGHFDAVIKSIDEMIQTLDEEGDADLAKKTQCEDEYQKVALTVQDLEWKIKNNEAKIDKLEKMIELRQKEKAETHDQIKETEDFIKKITADRKDENEKFIEAMKDDMEAIKVITSAKGVLQMYYKKHKIEMGPIQGSVKMLQEEPAFDVDQDQAPDATFSNKGSSKLQSKGIISLMDYIIEDLQDEIMAEKKDEAKNQADYEDEMDTANKLKEDLESKVASLDDIISKRNEEKTEETKVMNANGKDLEAEEKYKAEIKPDCDWIMKAFDERASARAAERSGLVSAKEFLAGKQALLQLKTPIPQRQTIDDDDKLAHISFLGVRQ